MILKNSQDVTTRREMFVSDVLPSLHRRRIPLDQLVRSRREVAIDIGIADYGHVGDHVIAADGEVENLDAAHAGEPVPPQRDLVVDLPAAGDSSEQVIPAGVLLRGVAPVLRGKVLILNAEILLVLLHHVVLPQILVALRAIIRPPIPGGNSAILA